MNAIVLSTTPFSQIFCKVLEEVDIRILNIRRKLHQQLVQLPQSVEQQKKIIKTLINLEVIYEIEIMWI